MSLVDNEILEKLHATELEMLVAFDKVCRDNNLTYSLDSGTALGAVRHSGFIPWDDDVDIAMPRKDYERLQQIWPDVLPNGLFLQNRNTEPNYKRNSAKLRLEGTRFDENVYPPLEHNGIYIDIFPFDDIPSNLVVAKLDVFLSRCLFYILRTWHSNGKSPDLFYRFAKKVIDLMPKSMHSFLDRSYLSYCRKYEDCNKSKTTCYFWRMTQTKSFIFDKKELWPCVDINFEGRSVKIFKNPDYYLKMMYGDYMQLPPEEKRTCHLKGNVVFERKEE